MLNLATFKEALGDMKGAEAIYREALALGAAGGRRRTSSRGGEAEEPGRQRRQSAQYDDAIVFARGSPADPSQAVRNGSEVADALQVIGGIRRRQKNYAEAEPLLREALSIFEKVGENSTELATAQSDYGVVLCRIGRHDAARPTSLGPSALLRREPREGRPGCGDRRRNYGACLTQGRLYAEAEQQLTRAEARMSRSGDARWKDQSAKHFADLYDAMGKAGAGGKIPRRARLASAAVARESALRCPASQRAGLWPTEKLNRAKSLLMPLSSS